MLRIDYRGDLNCDYYDINKVFMLLKQKRVIFNFNDHRKLFLLIILLCKSKEKSIVITIEKMTDSDSDNQICLWKYS